MYFEFSNYYETNNCDAIDVAILPDHYRSSGYGSLKSKISGSTNNEFA